MDLTNHSSNRKCDYGLPKSGNSLSDRHSPTASLAKWKD